MALAPGPNAKNIAELMAQARYKDRMEKEQTYKSPIEQANALKERNDEFFLSPEYEQEIKNRMERAREHMKPIEKEDQIAFNTALMNEQPIPKQNPQLDTMRRTYDSLLQDYHNIYKGRYNKIAEALGRKDYGNFRPYDRNKNGYPEINGPDRMYAFFKYAHDEPNLDFARMVLNDREGYPNIQMPLEYEFSNDKYKFSPSYGSADHWRRNGNDWEHISTGTGNGYLNDIFELLKKENFK